MQRVFSERISRWLLPTVLILFILEVLSLPMVLGITYSGRSESPDNILTYTAGRLTWDSATGIDENGVAELNLFDAEYENVEAADGVKVVAPGTEGFHIVRLQNVVGASVDYTAVLYRIRTNDALPVEATLEGENFTDTTEYPLPEGVTEEQVVRAVSGIIRGKEILDFDISWLWEYDESADQNAIDTILGNQAEADEVTVGLYIVVEDYNSYHSGGNSGDKDEYITPDSPQTGDNSNVGIYFVLMLISLFLLILLLIERKREKKCEQC